MTANQLKNLFEAWPDVEFVQIDGFDEAVLGVVHRKLMAQPVLLYSVSRILDILETWFADDAGDAGDGDDGGFQDAKMDAEEYFAFNIEDAWLGEGTPAFLYDNLEVLPDLGGGGVEEGIEEFEAGGTD